MAEPKAEDAPHAKDCICIKCIPINGGRATAKQKPRCPTCGSDDKFVCRAQYGCRTDKTVDPWHLFRCSCGHLACDGYCEVNAPKVEAEDAPQKCPTCGSPNRFFSRLLMLSGREFSCNDVWHYGFDSSPKVDDAPQLNPFSKGYNHRNGKPVSDACGDGRHSECTETYMACHCTYRGGHKTPHAYLNTPVADSVVQGEPPAKSALEKLLCWIVEDTRELAKGRSLEMSDIESLLAHAEEACQSVFGCSLSSFRDGERGEQPTSNWGYGCMNCGQEPCTCSAGKELPICQHCGYSIGVAKFGEFKGKFVHVITGNWLCALSAIPATVQPVASPTRPEPQWTSVKDKEPPHGDVLLVVINKTVQHMPAIWDGTEWIWLDSSDEDDPVPTDKITHWSRLPKYPGSRTIQSDPRERQEYWEAGRDAAAAACEKMCVTCYDRDSCHSDDIEAISALTYPGTLSPKHDSTEKK